VTLDVVADWQSRKTLVGESRAEGAADSQQVGVIDLTEEDDSIQDSQPPRPAKRRKITNGPNPTSEEQTPERKPRRVGTVESARFQSVSQESVAPEERPNEIKDSYEEEQQLSLTGVGKARVEIPGPQEDFDRDAYATVVTSSQPSQTSHISQLPQSAQSQTLSAFQLETPAPRHRYSSLIWDEEIERVIPDSQEPASSYQPSETQLPKTVTISPEITAAHSRAGLDNSEVRDIQVTSSEISSPFETVDGESAEPFSSQASYVDTGVQSSSAQTESCEAQSSVQIPTGTQDLPENQVQNSGPPSKARTSADSSSQLGVEQPSSPDRTSAESLLHPHLTEVLPHCDLDLERSIGLLDTTGSPQNSSVHVVREQSSPFNLLTSSQSGPQLPKARSERETVRTISPLPLNEAPSSPLLLPTLQSTFIRRRGKESSSEQDTTYPPLQNSQSPASEALRSSSIEFETQVPLEQVEDNYPIASSPYIRSSAEYQQSQTLREESHQSQLPVERLVSTLDGRLHAGTTSQPSTVAPATPVQTPREDFEEGSAETTSVIAGPPLLSINTQRSPSPSKSQGNLSQRESEKRSQESSNSLPSPPLEKTDSSAEQFAQLTSQNQLSSPLEHPQSLDTVGQQSPEGSPSTRRQSTASLETRTYKRSRSLQPALQTHAPRQHEETIGSSGSSRSPKAPVSVDLTMDDSPIATTAKPDNPVLAKLKLRKAEALARRVAERERAASASRSLPQSPSPPSPTLQSPARLSSEPVASMAAAAVNNANIIANQALPLQQTIEDVAPALEQVVSQASPEAEVDHEAELPATSLRVLLQEPEEYVIPLPMVSYARDVYVNAIRARKSQRYAFLTDEVFDASLVREIDAMIDELDQLCSHQDLIVDDFSTQRMEVVERQAKWAENISTKCIFLAEFLSLMQTEAKQIAILVRPGRMLEILEALFTWHGFVYSRADRPGYSGNTSGGPMQISLIPTQGKILGFDPPSVVIAFDSTYTSVPFLKTLRLNPSYPTKLVPLLPLIVTHSIEHLEKCFPRNLEPVERKIKLVSCLTQIADGVGKLGSGYLDPPLAAKAVAEYVVNGTIEGTWPLLPMAEIEDLKLDIDGSQSRQHQEQPAATPPSDISLAQVSQFGMKRQLVSYQIVSS
jgi:Class II histone deacetylase complex subunits 2 and 3